MRFPVRSLLPVTTCKVAPVWNCDLRAISSSRVKDVRSYFVAKGGWCTWWAAAAPPQRASSWASRPMPSWHRWRRRGHPGRCVETLHSASTQQAPRAHLGAPQLWGSTRDRDRARDRHPQLPSLIGSRCDAGCSAHSHGCSAQRGAVPAKAVTAGGGGPRWHVLGPTPRGRRACEQRCLWGRCRSCHCRGPDGCAVPRRGTFL